jgi:hypothetical protein
MFIVSVVCVTLSPFNVHAETTPSVKDICTALPKFEASMMIELHEKKSTYTNRQLTRTNELTHAHSEFLSRLASARQRTDASRTTAYRHSELLATTPEEMDAVNTFKSTIDGALSLRRNTVDTAMSLYKVELMTLLDSKFTKIQSAFEAYQNTLISAFSEAEELCKTESGSKEARQLLQNNLKDARALFKQTLGRTDFETSLNTLQATRNKSIERATRNYQKVLGDSRTILEKTLAK